MEVVSDPKKWKAKFAQLDEIDLEQKLGALLQRTQEQESERFQELAVAFAAGGVSLIAVLFVLRACGPRQRVGEMALSQVE